MTTTKFSTTAAAAIDAFESTAQSAIDAYREGGQRIGELAGERWASAFRKASPRLTAETRKNAAHARKVVGGYYTKGMRLSARGAEIAVETIALVASTALERADAFAQQRPRRPV